MADEEVGLQPWERAAQQQQQPWERAASERNPVPGMRGIKTLARDTAASLGEKIAGKNEFDYPEITDALMSGQGKISDTVADAINNLGESSGGKAMEFISRLKRARGEKGAVDVLRQFDPDLEEGKDKYGNTFVKFSGEHYYINRSGLSSRDWDETFRDLLLTMPFSSGASAVTARAGTTLRTLGQSAAGAVGSLVSDYVSRGAGSKQNIDIGSLVASALGGGGGELAGTTLGWAVNRVMTNPKRYVNMSTGELTNEGAMIFSSIGMDPSDVTAKLGKAFADRARESGAGPATARQAAAEEFGNVLLRGQAEGDINRQQFEEAARHGAKGIVAEKIMGRLYGEQERRFAASKNIVGEMIEPGQSSDFIANAGAALKGARQVNEDYKRSVTEAYDAAAEAMQGTRVEADAVNSLPGIVRKKLADVGFNFYSPKASPLAQEALDLVDQLARGEIVPPHYGENFPGHTIKNTLGVIEQVRKIIGGKAGIRARAADQPAERYAVDTIVDGIDDWLLAQRDAGLRSGDPEAINLINKAMDLASNRFSLIGKREKWDDAGRIVDRMLNDSTMTDREAANYIYGLQATGSSDTAAKVAARMKEILGEGSDEWKGLRRGLFHKIVDGPEGAKQPGPREVSNSLLRFLSGNRALAGEMYSPADQGVLRRYARSIQPMITPEEATNPSKSGYEVVRALSDVLGPGLPGQIYMWSHKIGSSVKAIRGGTGAAPRLRGSPEAGAVGAVTTDQSSE